MQVIMLVKGNFGCFIVKYIIIQIIKTSNNDKFKCYGIQKLINLSMQMCAFVLKVLSEVMLQR